ncbi:MAG: Ig domain-containing protein [Gracilimonas sp.]
MNTTTKITLLFVSVFLLGFSARAQEKLVQDYTGLMEIPNVIATEASPAHLYVLSGDDGMAVFRAYPDSLQWLYTSSGMQRRGSKIMSDIRFAYLFGDSNRLTVLEPTSPLGVYSSTYLPTPPKAAARIDNSLYIALGNLGLGMVSLRTPESVDTDVKFMAEDEISGASVIDIRSTDFSNQLFVLTDSPGLLIFNQEDSTLELSRELSLRTSLSHIFIDEEEVWGSTSKGEIYEIRSNGIGKRIGTTNEPVQKIVRWQDRIIVRTTQGRVWITDDSGLLGLWKDDRNAGNYIANSSDYLWISENDKISNALIRQDSTLSERNSTSEFKIKTIPNQVLTYPSPLIMNLEMEGDFTPGDVEFSYRSNANNAKIRKQGFYWQPSVNQIGNYWFNIVATNAEGESDSTRFVVDVRSFNSPPRFSPVRSTSIAVNEEYEVEFTATDPDSPQNSLVRYIGVDMPDGASINEKTGEFTWTPSERQVGETTFKIIATDRLGAASSIDVTLKVLDITRESEE